MIVAISLTICSLASAMQTIPSDCEAWYRSSSARDNPGWRMWWNIPDTKSTAARSACLGLVTTSVQDIAEIQSSAPKSTRLDKL